MRGIQGRKNESSPFEGAVEDITERKLSEKEPIAASEAVETEISFKAFSEQAMDGISLSDMNGNYLFVNPAFCSMVGYSESELLHLSVFDLKVPDDHESTYFNIVVAKRQDSISRKKLLCKDKSVISTDINGKVIQINGKEFVMGIVRDVTKQVEMEAELVAAKQRAEESEFRLKLAAASAHLGIWDWNVKDNVMLWNERMFELYGVIDNHRTAKIDIWANGLHPEDKERAIQECDAALKGGRDFNTAFRVVHPDGKVLHLKADGLVIRDADHQPLRMIGINRDITEKILAEEKLKKSESLFRQLFDAIPESVLLIGTDRRVVIANQATARLYGYESPEQLVGFDTRLLIAQKDRERASGVQGAILDGKVSPSRYYTEVRRDGSEFLAEVRSTTIFGTQQEVTGYLGITRDITESRLAEEKIQELNRGLEEKVRRGIEELRQKDHIIITQSRHVAMGELLSNIAHQWRQPLNVLALVVQNLCLKVSQSVITPDYLASRQKLMMETIQHMSQTIDDFRDFFKADKIRAKFMISRPVTKIREMLMPVLENHGIAVELQIQEDAVITGNENEFGQALINLINNALEILVERKTGNPEIRIRHFVKHGLSVLTVQDNGGGIIDGILDKIFEPYFSTKEMGTGLGLYMCKTIIEKNMGGALSVRNVDGGAEFRVELKLESPQGSGIPRLDHSEGITTVD